MQYLVFREQLKNFRVFSVSDIRKIDPKFYPARLNDWQKMGYIKKLRRGYYIFTDTVSNEDELFLIANHLYAPSYVSFESALSYYGFIPEGVYSITSVCSKKTSSFQTPIALFTYHRLKSQLLFGYRLERLGNQSFKIAEMEKAVLDYLYLNPKIAKEADFHEWRFNSREFLERANMDKLRRYSKAFASKSLLARLDQIIVFMNKVK
ncbi:MAG TPA: hypothetical protein VJJ22_03595 [Candidatus Paceibacterota bacterium]